MCINYIDLESYKALDFNYAIDAYLFEWNQHWVGKLLCFEENEVTLCAKFKLGFVAFMAITTIP